MVVFTFFWTMRAEFGAPRMRIRTIRAETCDWHSMRRAIEEAIGLRRGAINKRVDGTVSAAVLVRGRVIANSHSVEGMRLDDATERAERLACLPYLEQAAALEEGDFVVVERIPPNRDTLEQLAIAGYCHQSAIVSAASVRRVCPERLHRLLRLSKTSIPPEKNTIVSAAAEQQEKSPSEMIRETLVFGVENESSSQKQQSSDSTFLLAAHMSEAQRIEAIIQNAAESFDGADAVVGVDRKRKRSNVAETDDEGASSEQRVFLRYDQIPPSNYVCRRCGIAGHWLRHCPTHGNRDFDRARALSTSGIPKAMLRPIETVPDDPDAVYYIDQLGNLFEMREETDPERIRFDRARTSTEALVEQALQFPTQRR